MRVLKTITISLEAAKYAKKLKDEDNDFNFSGFVDELILKHKEEMEKELNG